MSRSIRISPKHGVNPTIPVCIFCGQPKNEIALLGHIKEKDPDTGRAKPGSDMQAPMHMVLDSEPCENCANGFKQGVTLIGVSPEQKYGLRPVVKNKDDIYLYVNGDALTLRPEAASGLFERDLKAGEYLYVEHPVIPDILKEIEKNSAE